MLPIKGHYYRPPAIIHCPVDHLRMTFHPAINAYRCNLPRCPVAYTPDKGYYRIFEEDAQSRELFYAQTAICLCENDDSHSLYIEDYVIGRKVRFWVCPVRACGYEVSQRLEKTSDGWRTCGSFEHTKPVKLRHKSA